MIIEGLGQVSFINGVLRVQTMRVGPSGKMEESGTIELPGNVVGDVINLLANAAQGISDKIGSEGSDTPSENTKKDKKDTKKKK
jgi:hypothetical protein